MLRSVAAGQSVFSVRVHSPRHTGKRKLLSSPVEFLESRLLLTGVDTSMYRGFNSMDQFDPVENMTTERASRWGATVIREGVFDFNYAPFGSNTIAYAAGSYLHGMQDIVNHNSAAGLTTILCPFSWVGSNGNTSQIAGKIPNIPAGSADASDPSKVSMTFDNAYGAGTYQQYLTRLTAMGTQFKDNPNVWIETGNELYGASVTTATWLANMQDMVTAIRTSGFKGKIVVPGDNWGTETDVIVDKGAELMSFDPEHNILFDIHAYSPWTYDRINWGTAASELDAVQNAGCPVFFGEYGPQTPGSSTLRDVGPLLQILNSKSIGALAWSWKWGDGTAVINSDGSFNDSSAAYYFATQALNFTLGPNYSLPSGWSSSDIGSPSIAGSTHFTGIRFGNRYVLSGAGSDIWNSSDQLQFASRSVSGDQTIIARVAAQEYTDDWAKAGIMFRDGSAANAMFASVLQTSKNGIAFQWRSATGTNANDFHITGVNTPTWAKLVRSGNTFAAYYSTDGSTWSQLGDPQTIAMSSSYKAGLAVTSHDTADASLVSFDSVTVAAAPSTVAFQVSDGSVQRSMVKSLTISFDQPVTLASDALSLVLRGSGSIPFTLSPNGGLSRSYILLFAGSSLADGIYDLSVKAASVQDGYGQSLNGGNRTFAFHRLYGDANGDKSVNSLDNFQLRNTFGLSSGTAGYLWYFDYSNDGTVNSLDNFQFRARFGTSLLY